MKNNNIKAIKMGKKSIQDRLFRNKKYIIYETCPFKKAMIYKKNTVNMNIIFI